MFLFTFRLRILEENVEAVDKVGTVKRIAANANAKSLTEANHGGLVDSLIGKSSGSGDDSNAASLVDVSGHNANLALKLIKCFP